MTTTRIGPEGSTYRFRTGRLDLAATLARLNKLGVEVGEPRGDVWWTRFDDGYVYQQVGTLWTGTTAAGTRQSVARPRTQLTADETASMLRSSEQLFRAKPSQHRGWDHYRTTDGADYWCTDVWHAVDPDVLLGRVARVEATIPCDDGPEPGDEMDFAGIVERLGSLSDTAVTP